METARLLFRRAVTGKISKLPPEIREWINQSLEENVGYDHILAQLAAKGHSGFNKNNLSRWRRTGYHQWLHKRDRKEQLAARFNGSLQSIQQARTHNPKVLADLRDRVIASELCNVLIDFDEYRSKH